MNDLRLWAKGSKYYELLKVVVDMKNSGSWAHGSRSYDQLKFVIDIKDSRCCEPRPLDLMNPLGLCIIWMILDHELKPLDAMNFLGLWMTDYYPKSAILRL